MLKIPAPRLLPATIAMLAALLLLKSGLLLQGAVTHSSRRDSVIVGKAYASSTEKLPEVAKAPSEHGKAPSEHGKPGGEQAAERGKPNEAPAQQNAAPAIPPVPEGPPPVSETERALLQELRERRQELDARADAAATRESLQVATELKLASRVVELQSLQKRLEGLESAQKQKEDAGWQGLVKLYETMKPKDAATIFNDLAMPVMLQVFDRMKDAKAAAVMAAMNPDKARDVTAELAQLRTGRLTSALAPAVGRSLPAGG
jgi:flagellar motility protein MotE (MotC chaperone)